MHPLIPYFQPPAWSVGPLTIHGFGVLVAIGFLAGSAVAQRKAERFAGSGDAINRLVGWLVLGTFVGGHVGHLLLYEPATILEDPMSLLRMWQGLSSYGGFVVCVAVCVWFFRTEKLDFWRHADALAIGLALGWCFGRLGCFVAHDHAGGQTDFWLGVYGMCPGGNPTVACHDLGLYEAFWAGGMWIVFELLDRARRRFNGFFVGLLAATYGPFRLVLDAFRHPDVDTRYLGFTPAQYGALATAVVGVWILTSRRRLPPAS